MVLDDVADGSGLVVEGATALHSEVLGHGDLDALDVSAVPEGLHEGVGEAEGHHVLDGALGEVVVDAEDGGFGEGFEEDAVELFGGGEVVAEGFFDDHASAFGGTGVDELVDDFFKERGRDGEVVGGVLGSSESGFDGVEGGGVGVVTVDVAEERAELVPGGGVEAAVLAETVLGAGFELVEIPAGLGDSDDGDVEGSSLDHGLEGGKDFFVGEVAGGAEEDECVGLKLGHGGSFALVR